MQKITLKIYGMMCGMCEAHVNDEIRKAFDVKKVTSSHTKKETVIICEGDIDEGRLAEVIAETGYTCLGITKSPTRKRGCLVFLKNKRGCPSYLFDIYTNL